MRTRACGVHGSQLNFVISEITKWADMGILLPLSSLPERIAGIKTWGKTSAGPFDSQHRSDICRH